MIKKQNWIPYSRKAKTIELNIKDHHEQTIDFFKLQKGKSRDTRRILKKIREKYDFDLNGDGNKIKEKLPRENNTESNFLKKDIEW